jgi:diacylglycerol kinase family enzyme
MKQMPLHRKLAIKGQVSRGSHKDSPEAIIFSAHRVEFSGSHPVLAQMDGETVRLEPEDFPAVLKLTAPMIPLLKLDIKN